MSGERIVLAFFSSENLERIRSTGIINSDLADVGYVSV